MVRIALHLDIEPEAWRFCERENFVERRHASARKRFLLGKVGIAKRSAIPLLQFCQRHLADERFTNGTLADFGIHRSIMRDDEHVIPGRPEVQFNPVSALPDGVFKAGDRIFREDGSGSAVSMNGQMSGRSERSYQQRCSS